jgi:hypothetical protein
MELFLRGFPMSPREGEFFTELTDVEKDELKSQVIAIMAHD